MKLCDAQAWLTAAKQTAEQRVQHFLRVEDSYSHMDSEGMKFMPDYMAAKREAVEAVSNLEATRIHIARMIPNVLRGNMGRLQ